MLWLAAAVVVMIGLRSVSWLVGPVFLSMVLAITVYPAQAYVLKRGWRPWLALVTGFVLVALIVVGIGGAVLYAIAKFGSILPQYEDEAQERIDSMMSQLDHLGISSGQQQTLADAIDPSKLESLVTDVLSGLVSLTSSAFLLVTLLFFVVIDSYRFPVLLETAGRSHPSWVAALTKFARGTRTYLVVSTIFGLIVAVIDTIVLVLLGIPAAAAWGVLAFVTNYVPNIGFVIGLIPPAALGLLEGGPALMVWVILAYCAINFVIQSLIQPNFVGDAVGLTPTLTFISLVFWAWALGAVGALLAVPLSLFVRAVLVDADDRADWLRPLLRGKVDDQDAGRM
jgi:predicted PurR-regulated permease PerM